MPRYSHILFDHDGVLVDTEPLYYQATLERLADHGHDLPLDEYLDIQAEGGNAWLPMTQAGHSEEDIQAQKTLRNIRYQALITTADIDIEGVEAVLTQLGKSLTLAIVTTARQEDFDLIHRHRSIVQHMDLVLTNKDYARAKPEPDPYLAALEYFGIDRRQALVVEDSERGLRSAVAAGIDCAVVYHPFTAPQDFSQATYRINSLAELEQLIQ